MPEPTRTTSKFDGAPRYMPAEVVRAKLYPDGGSMKSVEDETVIPRDHYLAVPSRGEPFVAGRVAFEAGHMPVEGHPVLTVTRSSMSRRAVLVRGRMHVEGDFETHDPMTFLAAHALVSDDGRRVFAHGSSTLALQRRLVEAQGEAGAAHARALRSWRDHLAATSFDVATQQAVNEYDLAGVRERDAVSDGMATIMSSVPPEGLAIDESARTATLREGSVLGRLVDATGIDPRAFVEARHMPTYAVETYRALTRRLLAPFLGEQALETVLVSGTAGPAHPLEGWAREGEMVRDADPVALPEMPGYVTSQLRHYRRDGVDVLCFEDAGGGYAYCWPSPEEPSPRP